jgi:hypothetical protein
MVVGKVVSGCGGVVVWWWYVQGCGDEEVELVVLTQHEPGVGMNRR